MAEKGSIIYHQLRPVQSPVQFMIYNFCNNEKMKYKDFLLAVMVLWTTEEKSADTVMDMEQNISNTANYLRIDPPFRLSGNMK